jgi:hypothetical protein
MMIPWETETCCNDLQDIVMENMWKQYIVFFSGLSVVSWLRTVHGMKNIKTNSQIIAGHSTIQECLCVWETRHHKNKSQTI